MMYVHLSLVADKYWEVRIGRGYWGAFVAVSAEVEREVSETYEDDNCKRLAIFHYNIPVYAFRARLRIVCE
jgi:hypothetical protein